jgi:hypothetical protein
MKPTPKQRHVLELMRDGWRFYIGFSTWGLEGHAFILRNPAPARNEIEELVGRSSEPVFPPLVSDLVDRGWIVLDTEILEYEITDAGREALL